MPYIKTSLYALIEIRHFDELLSFYILKKIYRFVPFHIAKEHTTNPTTITVIFLNISQHIIESRSIGYCN